MDLYDMDFVVHVLDIVSSTYPTFSITLLVKFQISEHCSSLFLVSIFPSAFTWPQWHFHQDQGKEVRKRRQEGGLERSQCFEKFALCQLNTVSKCQYQASHPQFWASFRYFWLFALSQFLPELSKTLDDWAFFRLLSFIKHLYSAQ